MPPSQHYSPEVIKLLDFVEDTIVSGLQHGFFEVGITGSKGAKELRQVVVKAGKTHKFNIRDDEVPR